MKVAILALALFGCAHTTDTRVRECDEYRGVAMAQLPALKRGQTYKFRDFEMRSDCTYAIKFTVIDEHGKEVSVGGELHSAVAVKDPSVLKFVDETPAQAVCP